MHRIFEDFVCVALREQLRGRGGEFAIQKPLHLVYAAGPDYPETHLLRGSGIEIVEHALNLDTTREDLMDQIRRLADAVRTP